MKCENTFMFSCVYKCCENMRRHATDIKEGSVGGKRKKSKRKHKEREHGKRAFIWKSRGAVCCTCLTKYGLR